MTLKTFPGLSSRAFEHPSDRAALVALKKMRGFDTLLKKFIGAIGEKRLRLMFLANSVRVNERQRPDLHSQLLEVCKIFDLETIPELYISPSPFVNAMAVGVDRPFIVLNSGSLQSLKPEEVRAVIAHEVGHILSGHALYKTLSLVLLGVSNYFLRGALMAIALPIILMLREWERKSELSADRASLLATQDLDIVLKVMMRLAGALDDKNYSMEEFEKQAEEYRQDDNLLEGVFKFLNLMWFSHPFPATRIHEIREWAASAEYRQILEGHYPKRTDDPKASFSDSATESAQHYRDDVARAAQTVKSFLHDLGEAGEGVLHILGRKRKSGNE